MKKLLILATVLVAAVACCSDTFVLKPGNEHSGKEVYRNFEMTAEILTEENSSASVLIASDGKSGYEIALKNGGIDGSIKSGSLLAVRNLYRSLAKDGEWFQLKVAVKGSNIGIWINGTQVVCYTEPEQPYRTDEFKDRVLSEGKIIFKGGEGKVSVKDLKIKKLPDDAVADNVPEPVNEQEDHIIRLQQEFFPVIDWHVHLKGDLTKEMAHEMSMNYGINYGVAPNAGEGGVGRMLADDKEVYEYYEEVSTDPFLFGVQGEGRKWMGTFSHEALGIFDYLFTDAMTICDHKGRNARIYRPEEVFFDGISKEEWMDHLTEQTVQILTNEPADIFANPTYIPDDMMPDYDKYWTDERIDRILNVLQEKGIALEINPRYRIPSFNVISKAKERGIKFVFGTNNVDSNFGRLEYCMEAIDACGIEASDIWFPSMSNRAERVNQMKFVLKRGTNLSHWLSQSVVRGEARDRHIDENDIIRLKGFGFDHVRIPIDEVQFWDEDGKKLQEAWDILTRTLNWTVKHNMRAIVDLHIIRAHNFNAVNQGETNSLFTSPEAQQRLIDMWKELSAALIKYPTNLVAYEFMNEPVADDPEDWNKLIAKVHSELRRIEPNRTLVIGSNMWQGTDTFKDLKIPEGDKNIILSFHFYQPMLLTHYKAEWNEYKVYDGPAHYPGVMVRPEEFEKLSPEQQAVSKGFRDEWDRDRLYNIMKEAIDVAAAYDLQLFCGEWGVYYPAPEDSRYNWYKDMISIFDEFGIAWTTWCYEMGFGFWNPDDSGVSDQKMLDILVGGKGLGE